MLCAFRFVPLWSHLLGLPECGSEKELRQEKEAQRENAVVIYAKLCLVKCFLRFFEYLFIAFFQELHALINELLFLMHFVTRAQSGPVWWVELLQF